MSSMAAVGSPVVGNWSERYALVSPAFSVICMQGKCCTGMAVELEGTPAQVAARQPAVECANKTSLHGRHDQAHG